MSSTVPFLHLDQCLNFELRFFKFFDSHFQFLLLRFDFPDLQQNANSSTLESFYL